jgi:quaternary ammonium compound-resistance protein SugE
MSWLYLILAGLSEIGFAIFLKISEQFTKVIPSILFVTFSVLSFYLMSRAVREIPMPIVYAVWSGIGIAGISVIEIVFFGAEINYDKLFFIVMILIGIMGLKLT